MLLEVTPNLPCSEITINVVTLDGVSYAGEMEWVAQLPEEGPYSKVLNIAVNPNDTSYMYLEIRGANERGWLTGCASKYFVTTGDSVEVYSGNPRYIRLHTAKTPKKQILTDMDDLEPGVLRPGTIRKMKLDSAGNLVPIDSTTPAEPVRNASEPKGPPMRPGDEPQLWVQDTSGVFVPVGPSTPERRDSVRQAERTKRLLNELHEMEQSPCTTATGQRFYIGDEVWVRRQGEYKFTRQEPVTDMKAYREERRRRNEGKTKKNVLHMVLDLRDAKDYAFVIERVTDLAPMERAGFYHAEIPTPTMQEIRDYGIQWNHYPRYPDERPKGRRRR